MNRLRKQRLAVLFGLVVSVLSVRHAEATVLFNNLADTTYGTETSDTTDWNAAEFVTDSSTYNSLTATLLLTKDTATSVPTLSLYSDGGLEPGTLLGVFTDPTSYSSTAADETFTLSSVTLAANTNYWLVLSAPTGSFDWPRCELHRRHQHGRFVSHGQLEPDLGRGG